MGRRKDPLADSPGYREIYSADDPSGISRTAALVACYVGDRSWAAQVTGLFPDAAVVTITADSRDDADVLHVGAEAASVWEARRWLKRKIQTGTYQPTVYCSRRRKRVVAALTAGLRKDWWLTDWTGDPHTLRGATLVEYASNQFFNVSLVTDPGWPHRRPPRNNVRPPLPGAPLPPDPPLSSTTTQLWDETMKINNGKHAETAVALPNGAKGIRISATPKGSFILDFGGPGRAQMVEVEWAKGEKDIDLPRDGRGRRARQVKIVRAATDIDGDASVVAI
jgi:hypothetical protein